MQNICHLTQVPKVPLYICLFFQRLSPCLQLANEIAINLSRPIFNSNKDVQIVCMPLIKFILVETMCVMFICREVEHEAHNLYIPLNYEVLIFQQESLKKNGRIKRGIDMYKRRKRANRQKKKVRGIC